MEDGFSFHKGQEVSDYMMKTISSWLRPGVVGAFFIYGEPFKNYVYTFAVNASTESPGSISISPASHAGAPLSKTNYSASPKHLHIKLFVVYLHMLLFMVVEVFLLQLLGSLNFIEARSRVFFPLIFWLHLG